MYEDALTLSNALDALAKDCHWQSGESEKGTIRSDPTMGCLLKKVRRQLPAEIISLIWEFLPPGNSRSLLSLKGLKTDQLLQQITPLKTPERSIIRLNGTVSAYMARLHGRMYICGIRRHRRLYGYESRQSSEISITKGVATVFFNFGLHGLRWIQLYDMDNNDCGRIGATDKGGKNDGWTSALRLRPNGQLELQWDVGVTLYRENTYKSH